MPSSRDMPTSHTILPHNSAYCFVRSPEAWSPSYSASAPPLSSSTSSYSNYASAVPNPPPQDPYNPQLVAPVHRQSLTDEGLSHPFGVPSADPNQVSVVKHVVHYTGGDSPVSVDARRLGAYHRCRYDTHSHDSSNILYLKHRRH